MTKRDDGDTAFPSHGTMGEVNHEGMSLRDWFAGQAMHGAGAKFASWFSFDWASSIAYYHADAMLAERKKP